MHTKIKILTLYSYICHGSAGLLIEDSLKDVFDNVIGINQEFMKAANRITKRTLPLAAGYVGYQVWQHKKHNKHTFGFGR